MTTTEAKEAVELLEHYANVIRRYVRIKNRGNVFLDITNDDVIKTVATVTGLEKGVIVSRDRHPEIVAARNITMYILNKRLGRTTSASGGVVGRDHSTCVYARDKMLDDIEVFKKHKLDYNGTIQYLHKVEDKLGLTRS